MKEKDLFDEAKHLSGLNVDLIGFIKKHSKTRHSDFNLDKKILALPVFIKQEEKQEIHDVALAVFRLLKKIFKDKFKNEPELIANYFELDPEYVKNYVLDFIDKDSHLIGRADLLKTDSGYKCLEFNISSNIGGLEYSLNAYKYFHAPYLKDFFDTYSHKISPVMTNEVLFNHILDSSYSIMNYHDPEFNIVMISKEYFSAEAEMNHLYKEVLKSRNDGSDGVIFLLKEAKDLYEKNGCVYYKEKRVHAIIDRGNLVELKIINAYRNNNVIIFNGPAGDLLANKKTIALLSESIGSGFLNKEEKENIKKYLPWTRIIRSVNTDFNNEETDFLRFLSNNKEQLVIKAAYGARGEAVFIGKETAQEKWDLIIRRVHKSENWIVQEYLESLQFPQISDDNGLRAHRIVWGAFIFGERYGSCFLSSSVADDSALINTAKENVLIGSVLEEK